MDVKDIVIGAKVIGKDHWEGITASIASNLYKSPSGIYVFDLKVIHDAAADRGAIGAYHSGDKIVTKPERWDLCPDSIITTPTLNIDIRQEKRQEKPCQVCHRMNDIGVKSCWHCTNIPH